MDWLILVTTVDIVAEVLLAHNYAVNRTTNCRSLDNNCVLQSTSSTNLREVLCTEDCTDSRLWVSRLADNLTTVDIRLQLTIDERTTDTTNVSDNALWVVSEELNLTYVRATVEVEYIVSCVTVRSHLTHHTTEEYLRRCLVRLQGYVTRVRARVVVRVVCIRTCTCNSTTNADTAVISVTHSTSIVLSSGSVALNIDVTVVDEERILATYSDVTLGEAQQTTYAEVVDSVGCTRDFASPILIGVVTCVEWVVEDSVNIDGIVLTKLDGTAKGGVVYPIINDLKVPIVFTGFGEGVDDLEVFDTNSFVDKILM